MRPFYSFVKDPIIAIAVLLMDELTLCPELESTSPDHAQDLARIQYRSPNRVSHAPEMRDVGRVGDLNAFVCIAEMILSSHLQLPP